MSRWPWIGLLGWIVACGPAVTVDTGTTSGSTSSAPSATTQAPTVHPSSTTGTPSTSATSAADEATTIPPPEPDLGSLEGCSIFEQNCPEGHKCMPWASGSGFDSTKCSEIVEDAAAPGEPCSVVGSSFSGLDTCDGTSMCWYVDKETNEGTCVPLCTGSPRDPICTGSCSRCFLSHQALIAVCLEICDPLSQACPAGQACYPHDDTFYCDWSTQPPPGPNPCEYDGECAAGYTCVNAAFVPGCRDSECCAPFCSTGLPDTCDSLLPGSTCTPWYDDEPPTCLSQSIGLCRGP